MARDGGVVRLRLPLHHPLRGRSPSPFVPNGEARAMDIAPRRVSA